MSGPREQTTEPKKRIEEAIWSELRAQDVYVDREMGMVDASGSGVDMAAVAAAVVEALGLTEEWGLRDKNGQQYATWHKSLESAQEHCDTNAKNFDRIYGHIPEVDDLRPRDVPVLRLVSGWSVVGGEPT